jgi:hypothetical protein
MVFGSVLLAPGLDGTKELVPNKALERHFGVAATRTTGKSGLSDSLTHGGTFKGVHVALPLRQRKVAHVLFTSKTGAKRRFE